MPEARVERRLAAILAADVAGYSRLMAVDEEGTLARLKAHQTDLLFPKIAEHRGRVVKTTGDGLLAEFASALDAVRCAAEVQPAMASRNAELPEERRIVLRIGINVGDVILDGGDIYGDGVNVAARIEGIAEPGGVYVTGSVHEQVRDRLELAFEDMGEHTLKNIPRPVRVYRVLQGGKGTAAGTTLALPDRPSIAVMPFDNMSGEPEQEFFTDGITEDIITELSRHPGLFVIARNSTFTFKGKRFKVQDVGRDLGVHYVVEGSVRKAGNRVRVTAQLIDASTGAHLWAQRFDRELTDIFALQDDITRTIVGSLPGLVEAAHAERIKRKLPEDIAAYECVLAAKVLHHRATPDDNAHAHRLVDRAIQLDPKFAQARAWKACLTGQAVALGLLAQDSLRLAFGELQTAIALDPNDIEANRVLCEAYMVQKQLDRARQHHDRAFELNPNDPRIVAQKGELLIWLGKPDEGADWIRLAMRLDPHAARSRAHLLGRALYALRQYVEAAEAYGQIIRMRWENHADIAACLAQLGEADAARTHIAEALRLSPTLSIRSYVGPLPYRREEDRDHVREGLRKAGLPE
jgi:adenylate cyclase